MNIVRGEQKSGGIQNKFCWQICILKTPQTISGPVVLLLIRIRFPGRDGAAGGGASAAVA